VYRVPQKSPSSPSTVTNSITRERTRLIDAVGTALCCLYVDASGSIGGLAFGRQPVKGWDRVFRSPAYRSRATLVDRFNITCRLSKVPINCQIAATRFLHRLVDFAKHAAKQPRPASVSGSLRRLYHQIGRDGDGCTAVKSERFALPFVM
jgi:hypothetical protein